LSVERMCALAGVSRASYYRRWRASAPRQEETGLRDVVQRLALARRHYPNFADWRGLKRLTY
jgi:putative transposase